MNRQEPAYSGENASWYPRRRASAARCGSVRARVSPAAMLLQALGGAAQASPEIFGEVGDRGLQHLALRDHDHVERRFPIRLDIVAEDLSNQTFGAVSLHRAAEFPRRDHAQPG